MPLLVLFSTLIMCLLWLPASAERHAKTSGAVQMVSSKKADRLDAAHQAVTSMLAEAHGHITKTGSADGLEGILNRYVAFDLWHRFLSEPRAAKFTGEQARDFEAQLPRYVAHVFFRRFHSDPDHPPIVEGARAVRRDVLVQSRIVRDGGRAIQVDWRLRAGRRDVRVIDIIGGATSFLLLTRDEFTAIIDRDGVEGLLTHMRQPGT